MERTVMLRLIDQYWKEHLLNLDKLRQGINLRAYAQRDPLNEYKQEAFGLFEIMVTTIREETVKILSLFELPNLSSEEDLGDMILDSGSSDFSMTHESDVAALFAPGSRTPDVNSSDIHRNALCPCGSGKRFKNCHGKLS
jgi:preprotein translocase subunit SecA